MLQKIILPTDIHISPIIQKVAQKIFPNNIYYLQIKGAPVRIYTSTLFDVCIRKNPPNNIYISPIIQRSRCCIFSIDCAFVLSWKIEFFVVPSFFSVLFLHDLFPFLFKNNCGKQNISHIFLPVTFCTKKSDTFFRVQRARTCTHKYIFSVKNGISVKKTVP